MNEFVKEHFEKIRVNLFNIEHSVPRLLPRNAGIRQDQIVAHQTLKLHISAPRYVDHLQLIYCSAWLSHHKRFAIFPCLYNDKSVHWRLYYVLSIAQSNKAITTTDPLELIPAYTVDCDDYYSAAKFVKHCVKADITNLAPRLDAQAILLRLVISQPEAVCQEIPMLYDYGLYYGVFNQDLQCETDQLKALFDLAMSSGLTFGHCREFAERIAKLAKDKDKCVDLFAALL
ncbi:MAG: hypothetical protein QXP01_01240 [Candidatus Hadarchaeum sp.]